MSESAALTRHEQNSQGPVPSRDKQTVGANLSRRTATADGRHMAIRSRVTFAPGRQPEYTTKLSCTFRGDDYCNTSEKIGRLAEG
jgi:hypothetical protein